MEADRTARPIDRPAECRGMRGRIGGILAGTHGSVAWAGGVVILIIALQLVFLLLSVLGALVPNDRIISQLRDGADQGLWNTVDYPRDGVGHSTERFPFAGVSDSFTECIALTMGVPGDGLAGHSPWRDALQGPHLGTCSVALPSVMSLAAGGAAEETFAYNRYWNGFSAVTRPALALGGVGAVRLVVGALAATAIVIAGFALARRVSVIAPLTLLAPLVLTTNLLTQFSAAFPHVLSISVALLGVALGAWAGAFGWRAIVSAAVVAGSLFNFVDFLLNPPLAWSLFAFAAAAAAWRTAADRGYSSVISLTWRAVGAGTVGWILGYGVTWVSRWALAVIAFGDSALREILGVVLTRLQGENAELVTPGLGQSVYRNLLFWWGTIPTTRYVVVTAGVVVAVALTVMVARRDWWGVLSAVTLSTPALVVLLWYEVLSNHSQIHVFFAYRSLALALGIVLSAFVMSAARPRSADVVDLRPVREEARA